MTLINRQDASGLGGKAISFQAAAGVTGTSTDTLVGGQCVHLLVNNTSGATRNITLITPETVEGALAVADRPVAVPTATIWEVPVPSRYNDSTGIAAISIDVVTGVTYAAVLGNPTP